MSDTMTRIEDVLTTEVRPSLAAHQGNVVVADYADHVLRIQLTGKCSGCPSALLTTEELIASKIKEHIPEVQDVILLSGVSDDLIAQAKAILQRRHHE